MLMNKIKTFPLRMDDYSHELIAAALSKSYIKSKHDWIMTAIAEKIERDKAV